METKKNEHLIFEGPPEFLELILAGMDELFAHCWLETHNGRVSMVSDTHHYTKARYYVLGAFDMWVEKK